MSITLDGLSKETRQIKVEFGGESIDICYRPGKYTPVVEDDVQGQLENGRPSNGVAKAVSEMLVWWDVVDGEGQRIPSDFETARNLSAEFLSAVLGAITNDQQVKAEERKNSGGGSFRVGR